MVHSADRGNGFDGRSALAFLTGRAAPCQTGEVAVPRPTLQLSTRAKVHATAVLTLLFVSLSVFVFSYRFNSRTIEISPQLTPHPFSDSSGNNGHSRVSLERIDSFWRFHYQLRPGFAYPYCALDLMLDRRSRSKAPSRPSGNSGSEPST